VRIDQTERHAAHRIAVTISATRWRALLALLLVGSVLVTPAQAQDPVDLTAVNLEDLLKMEVRSVSKKEQQLFRTPAAVYVLTSEDIRRSGASSLPDLLRLVPGLQVAQIDGNKFAVTARGFNGLWANKLLVLIDGRVVYTPVSSGVYWDLQDYVLEDIDRIEVVRGPGATVWGANAVNGVINITTKSAEVTQGGLVTLRVGAPDNAIAGVRYGGGLGSNGFYRLFAKQTRRGELVDETGAGAGDDARIFQAGFRADLQTSPSDSWTFEASAMDGKSGERVYEPITSYAFKPRSIIKVDSPLHSQFALARWTRNRSQRSGLSFQAFWDHSYRLVVDKGETTQTVDFEFQQRLPLGRRHDLVWGAGQRFWWDEEEVKFAEYLDPPSSRTRLFNAFVQDEIVLLPTLNLSVGSKFEHNTIAGFEAQPTARVAWLPTGRQSAWFAVSRAARTPSRIERALHVDMAVFPDAAGNPIVLSLRGNPAVKNEHTTAYEVGYRFEPHRHLLVDVAAFHNRFSDLIGIRERTAFETTPGPPHVSLIQERANGVTGESEGIELLARWQPSPRWRLEGSYDWLRNHLHEFHPGQPDAIALTSRHPEHQWRVRSLLTVTRGWQVDTHLLYTGRLQSVDVARYLRADVRVGGAVTRHVLVSIVGQNLLEPTHREFDGFEGVFLSHVRRGGSVKVTITF
jgi:iron complex outermembrane recepter protein